MLVRLIAKAPHICYVEPFCGAAHVFFTKPPSKIEVLNDLDGELINFFRCAQTVPEAVARAVASMPKSRKLHALLKRVDLDLFDPIQRAARFVYLIHRSFGGMPDKGFAYARLGVGGGVRSVAALSNVILAAATRLDKAILESLDFRECLEKYDAPTTLFYVDPPYLGADVGYNHNLDESGHRDLAKLLKKLKGKWLLTVGDHPLMRDLYRGYKTKRITSAQALKKGQRGRFAELIIRNF